MAFFKIRRGDATLRSLSSTIAIDPALLAALQPGIAASGAEWWHPDCPLPAIAKDQSSSINPIPLWVIIREGMRCNKSACKAGSTDLPLSNWR